MADADLVHLISLSLGVEPRGVVNFNYLHTLLHEIVRRLVEFESVHGLEVQRSSPIGIVSTVSVVQDRLRSGKSTDERDGSEVVVKGKEGEREPGPGYPTDSKTGLGHPTDSRTRVGYQTDSKPRLGYQTDSQSGLGYRMDSKPGLEHQTDSKPGLERQAHSKPGLADSKPGLADSKPGLADSKPGLADSKPGIADSKPGIADSKPGLADSKPRLADSKPGLADSKPRLADSKPGLADSKPRLADSKPGLADSKPGLRYQSDSKSELGYKTDSKPGLDKKPTSATVGSAAATEGGAVAVTDGGTASTDGSAAATDGKATPKSPSIHTSDPTPTDSSSGRFPSSRSGDSSKRAPTSSKAYIKRGESSYSMSRTNLALAANDVSTLDKKLTDIELRLNVVESLPGLLEKKASGATPISDIWNFASLDSRIKATENNTMKLSRIVDDLLGEFQFLKSRVAILDESGEYVRSDVDSILVKLSNIEELKLAAAKDTMGDAAVTMIAEKDNQLLKVKMDIKALKDQMSKLDISDIVTKSAIEVTIAKAMKDHGAMLQSHESSIKTHGLSMVALEKALMESSENVERLGGRVGSVEVDLSKLLGTMEDFETRLQGKVNSDNLAALLPQNISDDDNNRDDENLSIIMPKLLELQTKLNLLETRLGGLPPDVMDQIAVLKKSIETLTDELSSLSVLVNSLQSKPVSEVKSSEEDLSWQVAQLRERMNELDRAISALSDLVASSAWRGDEQPVDDSAGNKYVDEETFMAVQSLLGQLQQENERLLGTAAQISHEMEVNTEHVKAIYVGMEELKLGKADKTFLEVQVREKADRRALEEKASKNWVKSNFETLDKQIRDAMAKMIEREEAVKMVSDLNVEDKLDRIELQPFKDYVEKKLHTKELPKVEISRDIADEAAAFKKPLRFNCLSCDKPVLMKPLGSIPNLPSISVFPSCRSFRPYTTYELELIRRHQRSGYPIPVQNMYMHRNNRSAGGTHTVTHAYRKLRMVTAPFGSTAHTTEQSTHRYGGKTSLSCQNLEANIVGADGQVYKGRITNNKSNRASGHLLYRPTSSPGPTHNY